MPIKESISSDHFQQPETVAASALNAPPEPDPLAADEPLPESYDSDSINLLVQAPERIYLYWQHSRPPAAVLRQAFGDGATGYHPAVRLIDVESGEATLHAASADRAQWFDVSAGRAYRAEVGFAAPERPFIRVLTSNVALTPPRSVSRRTDSAAEFRVPSENFARMLSQVGYAEDASEVAREASTEAFDGGAAARHMAAEDASSAEGSARGRGAESSEPEGPPNWKASDVNSGARTSSARLRANRSRPF